MSITKSEYKNELIDFKTLQDKLPKQFFNVLIQSRINNTEINPFQAKLRLQQLQEELFNSRDTFNYNQFNNYQIELIRAYFGNYLIKNNLTINEIEELIYSFLTSSIAQTYSPEDLNKIATYLQAQSIFPITDIEELNKTFLEINSIDTLVSRKRTR